MAKLPIEYEEVDEHENLLFSVNSPNYLAYTYQMKHSHMLGGYFKEGFNRTMKNIDLVLANPPDGCSTLLNKLTKEVPTAILIERGTCSFTEKANFAQEAGASVVMVADPMHGGRSEFVDMVPDSSYRIVNIPCVYISAITGQYFVEYLEYEGDVIKIDIPVEKVVANWVYHQRRAPWEDWADVLVF